MPGYAGAHLGSGYGGSQEDRYQQRGYQSGVQGNQGYEGGGYQGGNYGNYQGGGYDRSQRGGYDRDDARGGNYGRGYDRDRDEGRGFAFQNNDYDRNYGGYQRDLGRSGDRGYGHDRFSESERGGGDYGRGYGGRYEDDRGMRRDYNMYSRDNHMSSREPDRGNYGQRDYGQRDYGQRDFGRHDEHRDFDRGMMGGYSERGSSAHDRDYGGGYGGRDYQQSGWRDDRGGWGERSHGGYERSSRFDDGRMPMERRWR